LHVLNCLHRSYPGGAHWRVAWVGARLRERDIRTTVLLPSGGSDLFERELNALGIPLERTFMPVIKRSLLANAFFVASLPVVVLQLVRLLRRLAPDLVHVNGVTNLQPVLAARLCRIPVAWHLNDMQTPSWYVRSVMPLMRAPSVRLLVATEEIVTHYGLAGQRGIDWHRMPAPAPGQGTRSSTGVSRAAIGVPDEAAVLGFVGILAPIKGCRDFLDAALPVMEAHADVHAVIVGPAVPGQEAYAQNLRARAGASGVSERIHFAGYRTDVASWLSLFDVFVFPSYSEACPIAVLEAMQAGVPVVATTVGEVPRMLRGIGMPTVSPGDVDRLRAGIEATLGLDGPARRRLEAQLRERVEQEYSLDVVVDLHERVYREAIAGGGPARS